MEIDSGETPRVVPIVGQRAAPPRRDQQVLIAITVHVVPRDARTELAQSLREERLAGPVVVRSLDVPMAKLRRDVAEPRGRGWGLGAGD